MRQKKNPRIPPSQLEFPFLFGRAFIEAQKVLPGPGLVPIFPFLFGRAFIEAGVRKAFPFHQHDISLPFWKGFH